MQGLATCQASEEIFHSSISHDSQSCQMFILGDPSLISSSCFSYIYIHLYIYYLFYLYIYLSLVSTRLVDCGKVVVVDCGKVVAVTNIFVLLTVNQWWSQRGLPRVPQLFPAVNPTPPLLSSPVWVVYGWGGWLCVSNCSHVFPKPMKMSLHMNKPVTFLPGEKKKNFLMGTFFNRAGRRTKKKHHSQRKITFLSHWLLNFFPFTTRLILDVWGQFQSSLKVLLDLESHLCSNP